MWTEVSSPYVLFYASRNLGATTKRPTSAVGQYARRDITRAPAVGFLWRLSVRSGASGSRDSRLFFVPGDGGGVRESVRPAGLHPVCAGPADLPHRADTSVKRMSANFPGKVFSVCER